MTRTAAAGSSGHAVRDEEVVALSRALAHLNDDQRCAIELHHLQGISITEVAELMGRSRPAIAGLLFRGLNKLREQMVFETETDE